MTDRDRTRELLGLLEEITPEEIEQQIEDLDRRVRKLRAIRAALAQEPAQQRLAVRAAPSDAPVERPKPLNKRPLIVALLEGEPTRSWAAREVRDELVTRGQIHPGTTTESIRVTLRRMETKGEISKNGGGKYHAATHGVP